MDKYALLRHVILVHGYNINMDHGEFDKSYNVNSSATHQNYFILVFY